MVKKILSFVLGLNARKYSRDRLWTIREKAKNVKFEPLRMLYEAKYYRVIASAGAYIPLQVHFDKRPVFPHWIYGIFISQGARVGSNCTIFHQVTIGSNTLPNSRGGGYPTIGDNVYIGAGAKIIGGVKIGNNVRIGANCVVVTDVPDNATVVLPKPRIIMHDVQQDNSFVEVKIKEVDDLNTPTNN